MHLRDILKRRSRTSLILSLPIVALLAVAASLAASSLVCANQFRAERQEG